MPKCSFLKMLTASLLVAGTSIGGGMIALPLATGLSGFLPSLLMMAVCCAAMTATGLLYVESCLWMEEGAHINTITSRILGPIGRSISWVLYLFVCYASLVAYTSGGGDQMMQAGTSFFGITMTKALGCTLFVFIFGAILALGSRWVGRINALLFGAMVLAYVLFIFLSHGEVKGSLLLNRKWSLAWIPLPLLLTSFSYQTMAPSLTPYLNRHAPSLKAVIIGGNCLTLAIYAVWQMIILGIIPVEGANGLREALVNVELPVHFIGSHVESTWVWAVAEYFAFFAMATSFIGLGFGLIDFLSDGFSLSEKGWKWGVLLAIVLVPTLLFAIKFEKIFLDAMDSTGGFGDTILNGLIPILIVWIGRYRMGYPNLKMLPGGKWALTALALFFTTVLTIEILSRAGIVYPYYEPYDLIEVPAAGNVLDV